MDKTLPYIPILKWKESEIDALRALDEDTRQGITPLFSLVPKETKKNGEWVKVPPKDILNDAIARSQRLFGGIKVYLDPWPLFNSSEKQDVFISMIGCSTLFSNNLVPVVEIEDLEILNATTELISFFQTQGVCLRVKSIDKNFTLKNIEKKLKSKFKLNVSKVELLFDSGITKEIFAEKFIELIKNSSNINEWRSLYFSSGNFPKNLISFKAGNKKLEREDWHLWLKITKELSDSRKLGYGDYTIQHPIYIPTPRIPHTSYSVRYALENDWLIMRGQADNAKKNKGNKQYFAHAKILVSDGMFAGEKCCKGCQYIKIVSENINGNLGNPPKWLSVGIGHHITLTLRQLSSLN
jgi:hypothetical protein